MASIMLNTDGAGTMKDILPLVKAALGYPVQDTTRDTILCTLAEEAMGKYLEMKPRIRRVNFTTVQNQATYQLPADLKSIYDMYTPSQYGYYNDTLFLPMIDTPSSSLFGYSDYAFRSPSERLIRSGILGELDHYATSFVGYKCEDTDTGPVVYLFPNTVASGLNVIVRYGADHVNASSDPLNPSWTTLPPGHWRHIVTLLRWATAMQRANMLTSSMNMAGEAGGSKEMVQSWQLSNASDRLLQQVRMALGTDVTVAIRS